MVESGVVVLILGGMSSWTYFNNRFNWFGCCLSWLMIGLISTISVGDQVVCMLGEFLILDAIVFLGYEIRLIGRCE